MDTSVRGGELPLGLGCVKTPAVAPHVEISPGNCIPESQIILHSRGLVSCWRIVFSTFCGCMSFYTGSVKVGRGAHVAFNVRFSNRPFGGQAVQTIHRYGVDVARGLVLLFGIVAR